MTDSLKWPRLEPAPRATAQLHMFVPNLVDYEREGGACPTCGTKARLLTCWECCDSAWVIDCSHRAEPPAMRHGRLDGSDGHRVFCGECAEVFIDNDADSEG